MPRSKGIMKIATIQVLVSGNTDDEVRAVLGKIFLPALHAHEGLIDFRIASASGELYLSDVPESIQDAVRAGSYQRSSFRRPADSPAKVPFLGEAFVVDNNMRLPAGRDYVVDDSIWLTVERSSAEGNQPNEALSVSIISTNTGADIAVFDHGNEMDSPRFESTVRWESMHNLSA